MELFDTWKIKDEFTRVLLALNPLCSVYSKPWWPISQLMICMRETHSAPIPPNPHSKILHYSWQQPLSTPLVPDLPTHQCPLPHQYPLPPPLKMLMTPLMPWCWSWMIGNSWAKKCSLGRKIKYKTNVIYGSLKRYSKFVCMVMNKCIERIYFILMFVGCYSFFFF